MFSTCVNHRCADICTEYEVEFKCPEFQKENKELGDATSVSIAVEETKESFEGKKAGTNIKRYARIIE